VTKPLTDVPLVSIIVLNWNGKRFIDSFFDSVYTQTYPSQKIEILFVDNASSDDSVAYFDSKHYPRARLVQTGANYGYSGGNNYGFREAKGQYIVVCNNDLELDPHWLENLVECATETDADIVVPKLVYAGSNTINNAGSILIPDSDWPNKERGIDEPADLAEFNVRQEVTAFCGASPLFKRDFLEEVGLFDKRFFLYWEDGDLSWRGQKKGKKYVYEPTAIAYHNASGSTGGSTSPVFVYYVSRNRILILVKNAKLRYALKAFAKVGRDHVLYKIRDVFAAIKSGQGKKTALRNLWLGIKIIAGTVALTPVMLCKRWKLISEEHL